MKTNPDGERPRERGKDIRSTLATRSESLPRPLFSFLIDPVGVQEPLLTDPLLLNLNSRLVTLATRDTEVALLALATRALLPLILLTVFMVGCFLVSTCRGWSIRS